MREYPEYLQLRTPAGTSKLLQEAAKREGKKPAQIVREAITARLQDAGLVGKDAA